MHFVALFKHGQKRKETDNWGEIEIEIEIEVEIEEDRGDVLGNELHFVGLHLWPNVGQNGLARPRTWPRHVD